MPRIVPCLWFDRQAEEAANLYVSVFPDSRVTAVVPYPADTPFPGGMPAGTPMTVEFELDGQPFTALNGGPQFTFSEATSLQVLCKDQDELDHYWTALTADGGEESMCGWLKDRFGFSWQVVPTEMDQLMGGTPEQTRAVSAALLGMRRIDVAALRAAYEQAG